MTSLFPNDVLERLERMRITATRRFTDRSRGEHLAGRGGSSIEFSDYRDYSPGDDVRFVDWNIFARLRRPYLKLYRHEEEMHVVIVIDASASMTFERKLHRARQLAGAFAVMGLFGGEKISVWAFGAQAQAGIGPLRSRSSLREACAFIEGIEGGGDTPPERGIENVLKQHTGRGMAVVISDFLTFGDVRDVFNRLYGAGLETVAIQLLGPTEIAPEATGDVRLVDAESSEMLDVSAISDLVELYDEHRRAFGARLQELCRGRGGRFHSASSETPLERLLFDILVRKGWFA